MSEQPTIHKIARVTGIAGSYAYSVTVEYPGEGSYHLAFHGSVYGKPGPVVMETESGQTFVTDPGRFGPELNPDWIRAFFGQ